MTALERKMPTGLSPSSLDLWLQCPAKFEMEKVQRRKDPAPTGQDAILGTAVHLVLEMLMQRPAAERTAETAISLWRACWRITRNDDEFKALQLDAAGIREFQRKVWACVRNYFEIENPMEVDVVATEQKVKATIGGVPLRGVIDRLERDAFDDLVVADYKNGKVPLPRYRASKYRQMNLYGAMVDATQDETPGEARLIFTQFGEVIATTLTRQSMDDAVNVAVQAWSEIHAAEEAREYPTKPGPLCGWCAFAAECPDGIAELRTRAAKGKLRVDAPAYYLTQS